MFSLKKSFVSLFCLLAGSLLNEIVVPPAAQKAATEEPLVSNHDVLDNSQASENICDSDGKSTQ